MKAVLIAIFTVFLAMPAAAKMDYDSIDAAEEKSTKSGKMDYDSIDG